MVTTESSSSTGASGEERRSNETDGSGIGSGWEETIKNIVTKLETVSSHFRYTEEYVLDHTPEWIDRKYFQALKEKWENSQNAVLEGFKSFALVMDSVFNKGQNYSSFVQGSFEEAMKMQSGQEKTQNQSKFVESQWWKQ